MGGVGFFLSRVDYKWLVSGVIVVFLLGIPAYWYAMRAQASQGLERLLFFGQKRVNTFLPEVRALQPPCDSPDGYDAQFYAQMSFDPTLRNPDLRTALDEPTYRAKRIFMSAVVYLTTLGLDPVWKLRVFALLNPLCWGGLLWVVGWLTGLKTWKDWACLAACALGSGVLFSFSRSLTDLPSAFLTLGAVATSATSRWGSCVLFVSSILTKETAILSLFSVWRGKLFQVPTWLHGWGRIVLIVLPVLLWWSYVTWMYGARGSGGSNNISLPLISVWNSMKFQAELFLAHPGPELFLALLIPPGLLIQSFYLFLVGHKAQDDPLWRMGIGFAVLLLFLGPAVWEEPRSTCRTVIPLTLSFNLLIRQERTRAFLFWFLSGNLGLIMVLCRIVWEIGRL